MAGVVVQVALARSTSGVSFDLRPLRLPRTLTKLLSATFRSIVIILGAQQPGRVANALDD
jgi:hypothetical protein